MKISGGLKQYSITKSGSDSMCYATSGYPPKQEQCNYRFWCRPGVSRFTLVIDFSNIKQEYEP